MTPFKAWVKACKELNQNIWFLNQGTNKSGDFLDLYLVIIELPPMKETGWNTSSERYYVLWFNHERFQSFTDYRQAIETFQNRCNQYVESGESWN